MAPTSQPTPATVCDTLTLTLTLQAVHKAECGVSLESSEAGASERRTTDSQLGQRQLSDTQAALRHALQQLEELTESNNEMRGLHEKLEQQSQAIHNMQERFQAVEAEKAQEHEQALGRSGQSDICCAS